VGRGGGAIPKSTLSRRQFLLSGLALAAARASAPAAASMPLGRAPAAVDVTLVGRVEGLARETVSFGLPLPPGLLTDPRRASVVDEKGIELPAAVRVLEPWRIGGHDGAARALLVQFEADFAAERTRRVRVVLGPRRRRNVDRFVAVERTLVDPEGLGGPRVLAVLPARWLCDSLVVGPQTPASESGEYAAYDAFVERNFPGSLAFLDSSVYHEWLFDRTNAYQKMYTRTGEAKFLEAAYHAAHFVRTHTQLDGPDAGIFTLKGRDLKYVYPRAMHVHYLLTGDERARRAGEIMARFCLENEDPVYDPSTLRPVELGVDPEKGRRFWTLRNQGYGLLGVLHGWELTGERAYWSKARECVDAYVRHQRRPPDAYPPDGSLRQDWALYDPNEATYKAATSAWMMALLLDPLFHYWTLTGDRRVAEIVVGWCDFLDRRGFVPDGSKAYYVINCAAAFDPSQPPGEVGPDMEMHNAEMAYTFALGTYFTRDPARRAAYRRRFDRAFPLAVALDVNKPARAFNWAFQFSSQLVYLMQHAGGGAEGHARRPGAEAAEGSERTEPGA
jgi:hypothetical protein